MTMRLLPLVLLLLATAAMAQTIRPTDTGVVAGVVTQVYPYDDIENAFAGVDPLPYVEVEVVGTPYRAVSVEGGLFSIPGVPPGLYLLRAQFLGQERTEPVVVGAGETATAYLAFEMIVLCEVVVVREYERMSRGIYAARVASYHETRSPHDPWGEVPCESWPVPDPSPMLHARTR